MGLVMLEVGDAEGRGGDGVGWDIEDWQASNGVGSFWGLFGVCKCAIV